MTKPRLTSLAVIATLVGYFLSAGDAVQPHIIVALLVGACLVGGGVNALNQWAERSRDAQMTRTADRPLPAARLAPPEALVFGAVLATTGVAYLTLMVGLLTGVLAALVLLTYVFVYTPLKTASGWSVLAGAIPGALPVLMGWAAAGRGISPAGWAVFAIVFVWQFPHFWAICWLHREDYVRAGFPMWPARDPFGRATAIQAALMCLLLGAVVLLPARLGLVDGRYWLGAALATAALTVSAIAWAWRPCPAAARRVAIGSIVYLPVLMG
ncbi:MAG: protoheme IX farnesyltransferase, partial [Planctomycetes bacterium]|nr:protoheme IX farnesyltransferase [Planctomycetota bacterium]